MSWYWWAAIIVGAVVVVLAALIGFGLIVLRDAGDDEAGTGDL